MKWLNHVIKNFSQKDTSTDEASVVAYEGPLPLLTPEDKTIFENYGISHFGGQTVLLKKKQTTGTVVETNAGKETEYPHSQEKEGLGKQNLKNPLLLQEEDPSEMEESKKISFWQAGDIILDDYKIEKVLGHGGMGIVYLATSQSTKQKFALKKTILSEKGQQKFLDELQVWIDLLDYPHLTKCHFFRNIGDELLIFAEFVSGGSLLDLIRKRSLAIEEILDIAIQFAWGLHAAHEQGVIHQDVKPANVLLTSEGIAKVADFGLAKTQSLTKASSLQSNLSKYSDGLVSVDGCTPAYQSPEQAKGIKVDRKTDIYSYGLSVLQMFTQAPIWGDGQFAGKILAKYKNAKISKNLWNILKKCLCIDPKDRWKTLEEVADALEEEYADQIRHSYKRTMTSIQKRKHHKHDRRTTTGVTWKNPEYWIRKALILTGKDPLEAKKFLNSGGLTRKSQAIADLAGYEQAQKMWEKLARSNGKHAERLASLYINKAFIYEYTEDHGAEIECYDNAILIYEQLVNEEGRGELAGEFAMVYMNKANALSSQGKLSDALLFYDNAISIYERLVNEEGRGELANSLAMASMNKANALYSQGKLSDALFFYDNAISIYERLVNEEGRGELANSLAKAYMNKATALKSQGKLSDALLFYNNAISIYERLVNEEGRGELANSLAMAFINKAVALYSQGKLSDALLFNDNAISIYERLVNEEDRGELANSLGMAYMNKANALYSQGKLSDALLFDDNAISIYKRLVNEEGRGELANSLAMIFTNKAVTLYSQGKLSDALSFYDDAISIYKRLVNEEGRGELANSLAIAYMSKANALNSQGKLSDALIFYDNVIRIYERLVNQESRDELANSLAMAYMNKANALNSQGKLSDALLFYDKAIRIYDQLLNEEGRGELANDLANAYMSKAIALDTQGELSDALLFDDNAIRIYERLVNQEGRGELKGNLAWVQLHVADVLVKLGRKQEARDVAVVAMKALEEEVARTGRADLRGVLNWACKSLGDLL